MFVRIVNALQSINLNYFMLFVKNCWTQIAGFKKEQEECTIICP